MELTKRSVDTDELLQAQAHIWNHLLQTICNMSLKCAVELGIPDIINNHGQPMTHSQLVEALPVPTTRAGDVHRLMRLLVHSGFFAVQKNEEGEGYVLTPSSKLLLSGSKMSQSPFLLMMLNSDFTSPWHFLGKWFQGKEASVMETATGMPVWEFMAKNPEAGYMFNKAMASDSSILMEVLVNECGGVFQGVGSLVDVGGGTGLSATTISRKFPHIKCTVLDLPHVVADAPLKTTDLDFVGGDMFESIPKADALFLKNILHDWSDQQCVKILKRCKEAIPSKEKGGKVILVDMVVDTTQADRKLAESQLCFDVMMMVHEGGKERDEQEWHKIFTDAGFSEYKITPVLGLRSVIELYP
ncbi:hypothetical protein MRB53_019412 [Persea americana]|uniref:Uncharacterized protein n=1 Tax=Persea americana TaxID=3435 RepID=A0ACC2KYK6_PERAE|nr:hypothetical protein MRB53_019412 [Persea americana]